MSYGGLPDFGRVAVAVPARDEAGYIKSCLHSLANQTGVRAQHVVVVVNNSTDGTADVARNMHIGGGTELHVIEKNFGAAQASAGHARRLAMDIAADLADENGIVMTTDADAVVGPHWVAANLDALRAGADAVAGWAALSQEDWYRLPLELHAADALECAYDDLCDEIHARLDPDPADPLPRHMQHSGASIAVTVRAYRRAGGMPAVAHGEDRAFFAALRRIDARIRHALECHVAVSGRLEGRAAGGMAETIRRRMDAPDCFLDDRLEPAEDCARRAALRQRLRACLLEPADLPDLAKEAGILELALRERLGRQGLGAVWHYIERVSPRLRRRRVAVEDLPGELARARHICEQLRQGDAVAAGADRFEEAA